MTEWNEPQPMPELPEASRPGLRPPRHAARGVVATWTRLVVVTLVGLIQAPILFRTLPPAELGVWYLFLAVATFIGLSDLGLPATFGRAVAYLAAREESGSDLDGGEIPSIYRTVSVSDLYGSAFVATVLLGLAAVLVALPAALLYFAHALPVGPIQRNLLAPLLVFLAGVVLNLVATIPGACLSGCGDVALDNAVRTVATLIGFGLICLLVPLHKSLGILCAIYVVQGAIALITSHLLLRRRGRIERFREMRLNLPLVRTMYGESASFFVSRMGWWLTVESTMLIAGYFLGSERIADFGILRQMVAIGASITTAIPIALAPHITAAHASGDKDRVRSLYLATVRYSLIANVLWTLGLLLWAPTVIGLLVGSEHFLGETVLLPLALASLLELHAMTHAYFVWNVGKWPFTPVIVAAGILNLALASAGCFFLGFAGLAWGSIAAQAATISWYQAAFALRHAGIAFLTYFKNTILRAVIYAASVAVLGVAIRSVAGNVVSFTAMTDASGRWEAAGCAVIAILVTTLLAGTSAWGIMLTKGDRSYFLGLVGLRG